MMICTSRITLLAVSAFLLSACQLRGSEELRARANLNPTLGNQTVGTVTFAQSGSGLNVHATITGLASNGEYGFHVHEVGDCRAADGSSAKEHFNPTGTEHGHYKAATRHAGDLPNLRADSDGRAVASFKLSTLTLRSGPTNIVGRALIVHSQPDDYKSQPAGNSGARIACAVIERV